LREGEEVEFVIEPSEDNRFKAIKVTGPGGAPPQVHTINLEFESSRNTTFVRAKHAGMGNQLVCRLNTANYAADCSGELNNCNHQQALVTMHCRVHPAGRSLGYPLQVCTWAMAWTWVLTGGVDEGQCPCNPADLHNQHMAMDTVMATSLPLTLSLSLVECPKGFRWGAAEGS